MKVCFFCASRKVWSGRFIPRPRARRFHSFMSVSSRFRLQSLRVSGWLLSVCKSARPPRLGPGLVNNQHPQRASIQKRGFLDSFGFIHSTPRARRHASFLQSKSLRSDFFITLRA